LEEGSNLPRVVAASPYGDLDRDGDLDILMTTNMAGYLVPERSRRHLEVFAFN